ncbi:mechanosensitive ion channel family protein [Paraburkholderia unamae]|uniref:Small-conductance mechanosensitive channel n=1 Tax=Paraburkholderia unamae TaxID=219649 RepID=A0ABX5KCQ8_9BURK|nr:mechanosensitive ion channel domain-containing protein [Paraburkholderia unamae]PVX72261.1 small-conductance mechanosensitive channel [Paraburkholderia unamae]CAG9259228.1 Small-conductance mechanosensitive channel [Paraburkholderia unamae]
MPTLDDFSRLADGPLQNWFGTLIVSGFALVFAVAVHWLGKRVMRRIARPYPRVNAFVRYVQKPALAVLVVLALEFVWWQAPDTLRFIGSLRELCAFALIAAMTWFSVRCAAAIGEAIIAAHPLDIADNLQARRIHTQARVLARTVMVLIIIVGLGSALMTFPNVRQIGASLLASAGVAGLVAGIAARPVLGNMIAGLQIALSQPIRLDDVVVIQGEWGRIEEITGTYVSVRIWDQRRLIVPLQWFIENPFANWTRSSSQIIGTVFLWLDYRMPLAPLREALARIVDGAPEWDRRVQVLQVTDANERAMQVRVLVSSRDSGLNFDLRCRVREGLLDFVNEHYPQFLPRARAEVSAELESSADELPAFARRPARQAASSTAAHTEADPVTGTRVPGAGEHDGPLGQPAAAPKHAKAESGAREPVAESRRGDG